MSEATHSDDTIRAEVLRVLGLVLGIEPPPVLRRRDCPQWDSLAHVQIVFALEDAFGLAFSLQELTELTDSDSIALHVKARLDGQPG